MFNLKGKNFESAPGGITIIGEGTVIQGDLTSNNDIRIDGTIIGNLHCQSKVLIGKDGVVEGNVVGVDGDFLGRVNGEIKVNGLLQLRGHCHVKGSIFAGKLQVEPSATFNGSCHMGANVVELNAELGAAVNQ
jgi:cytoskeletal protein CcmA (bactofilin family)